MRIKGFPCDTGRVCSCACGWKVAATILRGAWLFVRMPPALLLTRLFSAMCMYLGRRRAGGGRGRPCWRCQGMAWGGVRVRSGGTSMHSRKSARGCCTSSASCAGWGCRRSQTRAHSQDTALPDALSACAPQTGLCGHLWLLLGVRILACAAASRDTATFCARVWGAFQFHAAGGAGRGTSGGTCTEWPPPAGRRRRRPWAAGRCGGYQS